MEEIRRLMETGQILKAYKLYERVASSLQEDDQAEIELMSEKLMEVEKALDANDGIYWTYGVSRDGITATYRQEADGCYSVCLHGLQENIPLFEECATLLDLDRYSSWFPLCNMSRIIYVPDRVSAVFHMGIATPFLSRDALVHCWAADCLDDHQSLVFLVKSVDEFPGAPSLPAPSQSLIHDRGIVRNMLFRIRFLSPSSVQVYIEMQIDLKISLPQWLLSFIINNLLGILFTCAKARAVEIREGPTRAAAQHISRQSPFYDEVVLPRARELFLRMGWGDYQRPTYFSSPSNQLRTSAACITESTGPLNTREALEKSGEMYKLGLSSLFRPWTRRYFTLRLSKEPISHEAPVLTYYTCESRKKVKAVPLTSGMTVRLLRDGWDARRAGDPPGVGLLLTYGFTYAGRSEMLLVADNEIEARDWVAKLTSAIHHNDRHLLPEDGPVPGNTTAAAEVRNSIASGMGLIASDVSPFTSMSSAHRRQGSVDVANVLDIDKHIHCPFNCTTFFSLVMWATPITPLLVPSNARAALWIAMCYVYIFVLYNYGNNVFSKFLKSE